MAGYLDDGEGNRSSKRLCAVLLVSTGTLLAFILCGFSLFKPIGDSQAFLDVIKYCIGGGVALGVGGTAAESVSDLFNKKA